jgi:hypothetical protein
VADGRAAGGPFDTSLILPQPLDPARLGSATLEPSGALEAGSWQELLLTYTAGFYGIDDTGSLRIVLRFASDTTLPQTADPTAPGWLTAEASNGAGLEVRVDPKGNVRPWDRTVWIKVAKGCLAPGDRITVRLGDRRRGSPGIRLQTFVEPRFELRVLVDPIATFCFQPLPVQPTLAIVPGPPVAWKAVLPTLRRVGDRFRLGLVAEDRWGNPSDRAEAELALEPSLPVENLPARLRFPAGSPAAAIDGLAVQRPGDLVIAVRDATTGTLLATSNPLRVVDDAELLPFWGDIHGQSAETIGTNGARDYFRFARDRAFLDVAAHQGNDFQMPDAFWAELGRLTAEFDEPGRFVTLPGYEWSGNTALGGDRNVYFAREGRPMRRSSRAMILEPDRDGSDCPTAGDLFRALREAGEDAVCIAHVGGRWADLRLAHDGTIERAVEVHSAWGTFEWLLEDALRLGHRLGVVCNSDGHKGRPGAEHAGAAAFGALGGLTCFLLERLDRAAVLACLRRRRHYGTTGCRLHLEVRARLDRPGTLYHDDPALGPAAGVPAVQALMGDIVHLPEGGLLLEVEVLAGAPIERVEVLNGLELLATARPHGEAELGRRIRVVWEGAEYRGRARQVVWDGRARFPGDRIRHAAPINFFNLDKTLERDGADGLRWRHLTTGNFGGFDVWLEDGHAGTLELETPLVRATLPLAELGQEDRVLDASAALPRRVRIHRLPERCEARFLRLAVRPELAEDRDNSLRVRVTTEDGHRAWSSPVYVGRRVDVVRPPAPGSAGP